MLEYKLQEGVFFVSQWNCIWFMFSEIKIIKFFPHTQYGLCLLISLYYVLIFKLFSVWNIVCFSPTRPHWAELVI